MVQVQALAVTRGKNAERPRSFPNLATLPPEMAHFVLSYLNATDLCLAGCVWDQLGNDDVLWQGFVFYNNIWILLCSQLKHFN